MKFLVNVKAQPSDGTANRTKLNKLIDNEILLTQATQYLQEWPKKPADHEAIMVKCKQALKSGNGDGLPPRIEILPSCAAVLINSNEPSELIRIDRRFPSSELFSAMAAVMIELEQHKANASKKIFRDAWDLIAPMFTVHGGHSTSSSSSNNRRGHSTPNTNTNTNTNTDTSKTPQTGIYSNEIFALKFDFLFLLILHN